MTAATDSSTTAHPAPAATLAAAWAVTLAVSSLGDIILFELRGIVPLWLVWAKVGLVAALILATRLWLPIRVLRPYLVILLALAALQWAYSWVQGLPGWIAWQNRHLFAPAAIATQLLEMSIALILIGLLFLLKRRRERFFLVRGDLDAQAVPIRLLGGNPTGPLWRFGLIFTLFVLVGQYFVMILPLAPTAATWRLFLPLLPLTLLRAASNGLNEEVIFRVAPIAPLVDVVGRSYAIWMAAVLFGLSHYIGGIPSGMLGVLLTGLLGLFFGKCMVDSKGFFWPWLFHSVQDILPFTLTALAHLS